MAPKLTAQEVIDRHGSTLGHHKRIPTFAEMQEQGIELPHILISSIPQEIVVPTALTAFDADCGATMYRDNVVKGELHKRAPSLEAEINSMEFYEITG
ncbi:hypothetical protein FOPE_01048 [Fonsecaea pedrosoi]|nr:hypothetical protein FOPE_01048 [Fonsecaea pedrosoi]